MKAYTATAFSYCTFGAAACTSAPVNRIMDTAPLAVSIVITRQIHILCT